MEKLNTKDKIFED